MARKGLSHVKKSFKAQRVFTDREKPCEAFAHALAKPQTSSDYRLLNYYGVGGQGKTALCEQFAISLGAEKTQNENLGWATLDFEVSEHRLAASALLSIRLQLAERCKIPFPAFDTAFVHYFAFTRQGHDIHDAHPGLFKQPNDVLQDIESVIGGIEGVIPGVGIFYKYINKLGGFIQNWWQRRGKDILNDIEGLDQHKLLEALPTYLGADLYDWLFDENTEKVENKRHLVILMDTYEALWRDRITKTGVDAMRVDAWIRKLAEETPGILYVMLGRDKLNWAEYEPAWALDIKSYLLGGLSSQDADKFLQKVPIKEEDIRNTIICSSEGIPFYLDLQVDLYESLKQEDTQPQASNFGGKEEEILARFTDHLNENIRRALQIVSHARFIDESLTQQLAEEFLGGKASINFKQLTCYSFWKREGNVYYMHALMREYLQDRLCKDEPKLFNNIHQYLFDHYDSRLETLKQVVDITETHKQALTEAGYHQEQLDSNNFPVWAIRRGQIFYDSYAWEQVEPLWETAREIAETQLGKKHLNVAAVLNNLGELYGTQGEYAKAEPSYLRCLKIREEKLGEDHPLVAATLNNLGELYRTQGEYAKAEPLYQRSLKIRKEKLGEDHPDVAATLNNLGELYGTQGEYAKAEPSYLRCLKIREETLGEDHPLVANTLNNLGELYRTQGEYAKAEPLYQQSLKIKEETLGEDHPRVATTLNNLAVLYRTQGEYAKAEPLYQRSLKIKEEKLGEDHPLVANTLNNLALLYRTQGEYAKAEPLYQRSLKIKEETLGEDHPRVATTLNNLAGLYRIQGEYAKAEPLYQRSLKIRKEKLGEDHPDVAATLNNLGELYRTQGEYAKAEPLYQRSLKIRKEKLGEDHPDVAATLNNLGELYRTQGEYAKAEPLYQRSLKIRKEKLGEDHPDVAATLNNLGELYGTQGEYAKAEPLYQRAITILEKVSPNGHQNLDITKSNYAYLKKTARQKKDNF